MLGVCFLILVHAHASFWFYPPGVTSEVFFSLLYRKTSEVLHFSENPNASSGYTQPLF
jgi:hypothetical protein